MIDLSQMKVDELEQLKATIDAEVESRHSKLMDELDELLKNIKQLRITIGISKSALLKRWLVIDPPSPRPRKEKTAE